MSGCRAPGLEQKHHVRTRARSGIHRFSRVWCNVGLSRGVRPAAVKHFAGPLEIGLGDEMSFVRYRPLKIVSLSEPAAVTTAGA